MKYLNYFKAMTYSKINKFCIRNNIFDYKIKNKKISVYSDVFIDSQLTELPYEFEYVSGSFAAVNCELTSLKNFPKKVDGDLNISSNKLESLKGCTKEVGGNFICNGNYLRSLEYGPTHVGKDYRFVKNEVNSFKFLPNIINGNLNCRTNYISSWEFLPKKINILDCSENYFTNLIGLEKSNIKKILNLGLNFDLPKEIRPFLMDPDSAKYIIEWQNDYIIWNKNGSLNIDNFNELIESVH